MPAVFLYAGDCPWWLAPLLFLTPLMLPNLMRPFTALGYLLGELLLPVRLLFGKWNANVRDINYFAHCAALSILLVGVQDGLPMCVRLCLMMAA